MAMYVLGAGSLGCLWAAHLAKSAACHPTLLLRAGSAKLRHLKDGRVRLRVIRAERVLEVEASCCLWLVAKLVAKLKGAEARVGWLWIDLVWF